ncbi:MAG: hypothetical protein WBP52_13455, partial [Terriglobales bacterium]
MAPKLSASVFRTLLLPFTRVFSSTTDASARNGRPILAAAAGVCALLLLGGSVAAHAQSVTFAGTQTYVGGGLSGPWGVAVDGAGDIFIADTGHGRVVKVPAGGGPQTTVLASGLNAPYGVAVDGAGDVFI